MKRRQSKKVRQSASATKAATTAPISARRQWWFRWIALVVLPLLIVGLAGVLLETGLRLAGYGYETAFFRPIQFEGQPYFINNEQFSLRFFPAQLARWPDPFKLPAIKGPGTIRIFIFGESAAMGDPQPAYGAGRYMEMLLRRKFPDKKFEVINLGITAIDSHVILPIARECARHQSDFWIVYMGNNEMVGPYGAATVFGARALPRRAAQLNLAIQQTRTGQLLVSALRQMGGKNKNTSWGGMEMFLENQIAPNDPRKETVYRNFEDNLQDIVRAGVGSGAKVILSTVSVNLKDCPPFASLVSPAPSAADGQSFDRLMAEGESLEEQNNLTLAAQRFTQAVQLEPQHAEAHYRLAHCELALTNASAKEQFQLACDLDALPFRADTRINAAIRKTAEQGAGGQLVLCDAEKILAQANATGIVGDETFYEHVHFNFDGNYRLGKIWAEQVAQEVAGPGLTAEAGWASQATCEHDLGLSIWNREFVLQAVIRRLETPPLSQQFNNADRLRKVGDTIRMLRQEELKPGAAQQVRDDFSEALAQAPADVYLYEGLANFSEANNDPQNALAAYRHAVELMPGDFYDNVQLGRLLGEQGQPAEGEPFLRQAVQLRPSLPEGWLELGNVLTAEQKFMPALDSMEQAARIRPQDSSYVCLIAQLLAKLNRHGEAVASYRRAIQLDPQDWQPHFELAGELVAINQADQAIPEYQEAVKLNPNDATCRINLGVVYVRFNRLDDAVACFQDALKIEPDNRYAQQYLTSVLAHKDQLP
jgi:tetratricopeptide (TPR) repeat protein